MKETTRFYCEHYGLLAESLEFSVVQLRLVSMNIDYSPAFREYRQYNFIPQILKLFSCCICYYDAYTNLQVVQPVSSKNPPLHALLDAGLPPLKIHHENNGYTFDRKMGDKESGA